jgi:hypothetical protein
MTMNLPLYTALTAACILFLQLGLMLSVGLRRVKYRQGIGDGGHDDLSLLVRRHGNLAENGAIFVVVLAVLEIVGGAFRWGVRYGFDRFCDGGLSDVHRRRTALANLTVRDEAKCRQKTEWTSTAGG